MSALIDWTTIGTIFVESLAAGVLVVAAFALGARLVTTGREHASAGRSVAMAYATAGGCFLVAAAAVGFSVYFTIDK